MSPPSDLSPPAGAADLADRVAALVWHHRIDLGGGLVTPGGADIFPALEATLPDMRGASVLDVGAWDGYYSFLAERRGAARVVALDHYAWGVDLHARNVYWERCREQGVLPDHGRDEHDLWDPSLPGRRGFDLARERLRSRVEPVVADLMTADPTSIGTFDVVLYLGVLYHMREPLTALSRVRAVTRRVAVVETEGVVVPGREHDALLRFFPGDELGGDFGNWFATTETGLHALCRAAGFSSVRTAVGPPPPRTGARATAGALRRRITGRPEALRRYRLVVHAHV